MWSLKREIRPGDFLPPWYYSYAYRDDTRMVTCWYPVVLSSIMRVWHMLKLGWYHFRRHALEEDSVLDGCWASERYEQGRQVGYEQGQRDLLRLSPMRVPHPKKRRTHDAEN